MSAAGDERGDPEAADLLEQVVHDLRTPLTTISGFAELLVARTTTMDEQGRAAALEAIRRGAAQAAGLLDGLAQLLASERTSSAPEAIIDVAAALGLLAVSDPRRRAVVVDGTGPAWVSAAPDRLTGLLTAFLNDVTSWGPPEGPIVVVVDAGAGADMVALTVGGSGGPAKNGGLARTVLRFLVARMGGRLDVSDVPEQLTCHLPAGVPSTDG